MKIFKIAFGLAMPIAWLFASACTGAIHLRDHIDARKIQVERHERAENYTLYLQAHHAALTNQADKAAAIYGQFASRNGENTELTERAVFYNLLQGHLAEAQALSQNLSKDQLQTATLSRLMIALDNFDTGNSRKNLALLQTRDQASLEDILCQLLYSWALIETRGLTASLTHLDRLSSDIPLISGLIGANRGYLQIYAGETEAALITFQSLWDENIKLASTVHPLAILLHRSGQTEAAIAVLEKFKASAGYNAHLEATRRKIEAGKSLNLSRPNVKEGAALAIYLSGAVLSSQKKPALSQIYYTLALDLNPDLDVARPLLADIQMRAKQYDRAKDYLTGIEPKSDFYMIAQIQTASILAKAGESVTARQTLDEVQSMDMDPFLRFQSAMLYRKLGAYETAKALVNTLIMDQASAAQKDWRYYYARAELFKQTGYWPEAEADYLEALRLTPDNPAVLNALGYGWIEQDKHHSEAIKYLTKAARLRPHSGAITDSLGWAFFKTGQYEAAVIFLERAVAVSPGSQVINEHLGDAYWQVGRKREAGFQWQRAKRVDPESQRIPALQTRLAEGLASAQSSP